MSTTTKEAPATPKATETTSDHRSDSVETWSDVVKEAEHYLGVLYALLRLIGESPDHDDTAKGYVRKTTIQGSVEYILTERLGRDTLLYARRVAMEGWWDVRDAANTSGLGPNDTVEVALWRTERALAVTAAALRIDPFEGPEAFPYDVTSGLCNLVGAELERVRALSDSEEDEEDHLVEEIPEGEKAEGEEVVRRVDLGDDGGLHVTRGSDDPAGEIAIKVHMHDPATHTTLRLTPSQALEVVQGLQAALGITPTDEELSERLAEMADKLRRAAAKQRGQNDHVERTDEVGGQNDHQPTIDDDVFADERDALVDAVLLAEGIQSTLRDKLTEIDVSLAAYRQTLAEGADA